MHASQELALDRLDLLRHGTLDEISRLRCERAQACIDQQDRTALRDVLLDIDEEIIEAEALLKAIDNAAGDVRRVQLMSLETVKEGLAA